MADSKSHSLLLSKKAERHLRRELLLFFQVTGLYLSAGLDLSLAWTEGIRELGAELKEHLQEIQGQETLLENLARLEQFFVIPRYRFTFSLLKQLYLQGSPLCPAFKSFSRFLRTELERDLEAHLRATPTRANLLQIAVFLPATLALVFLPFLTHLRAAFFGAE